MQTHQYSDVSATSRLTQLLDFACIRKLVLIQRKATKGFWLLHTGYNFPVYCRRRQRWVTRYEHSPPPPYLNMSTIVALQARLKELSATLGQIRPSIDKLRNFTPAENGDEARVELGAEIHAGLKDTEDELELLRIEVEALDSGPDYRRKHSIASGEKDAEKERVVMLAGKLANDLKKWVVAFVLCGGRSFTDETIELEGIFGMRNCRLSAKVNSLGGRSVSYCSRDPSRLLSVNGLLRSLRRMTWCLMHRMMLRLLYAELIT